MPPTHSHNSQRSRTHQRALATRRRFLQVSVAATSGLVLSNCARRLTNTNPSTDAASPTSGSPAASDKTLNIFTWANYTDDQLIKSFKDATGIQVVVDTYDSNEAMLAKIQAGGGKQYSIVYPSDYMVQQMLKANLLSPLKHSRVQGINQLMERWKDPVYDPQNAHSMPAVWGTTGLIFDPENLDGEVRGWDYIWDNVDRLNRKVTMLNDVREVMGATLRYLGYSYNSKDPAEIEEAFNKLLEIKPAIASFITNGWEDQIASGDLSLSMAYSQDAIGLIDESPNLNYIVPETGASVWTDTMVIPKAAPNPDAAYEWLSFIAQPENGVQLVERLKISTPSQAVFDQLPASLQKNENLFPPKAVLAKCEGILPLPQEITELHDRYWTRLTST